MNFNFENGTYYTPKDNKQKIKKIKKLVLFAVIAIALIALISTCWYTVDEKQQAVLTTFGKVTDTVGAGIHFKLPFGIQSVKKVDVSVYQKIEIGYRSSSNGSAVDVMVENESKMITGDYNIVNVDFFVEYKISDPVKYLYNSRYPESILKSLVQSQIRNVIGSTDVDSVLTTGKAEIQVQLDDLITAELEKYDIGLILTDIKIQDSEPPTEEVIIAFKAVETAKQGAETLINEAKAYSNAEIPKAEAEADKATQNAEFLKQNRINEALKIVAKFEAMYSQYILNPEITRTRMYYEAIKEALPGVKLYINAGENGVDMMLPLDSFVNSGIAAE